MPTNDTPTRAQQQKGYRELENFVLSPKLESVLQDAVKNKATEKLKKDPRRFLGDKKIKVPADARITVKFSATIICIWVCKKHSRFVTLCVRRCFAGPITI